MYTVKDVVEEAGVSQWQAYRAVKDANVAPDRIGNAIVFSEEEFRMVVDAARRRDQRPGGKYGGRPTSEKGDGNAHVAEAENGRHGGVAGSTDK